MQTPKRKRYHKDSAPSDDIIHLIQLVRQNPALYNYKLQPNQRRRSDILNGWSQIAMQIGNKYTVEECRRKWKNLRDTYHQYRLRKSKVGDGLSKWRYAKELEFLSTVYQPKLKSHRIKYEETYGSGHNVSETQASDTGHTVNIKESRRHHQDDDDSMIHPANITLVTDDAETFILHAYEESVNDDVVMDQNTVPDDTSGISHIELTHDDHVENVVEIVKNEHHGTSSLDEDGATGAEVDYEEVCLYEESGNAPSVDSETIIGCTDRSSCVARRSSSPTDSKAFQYINTTEFCIEPASMSHANLANSAALSANNNSNTKPNLFKAISVLAPQNNVGSTSVQSSSGSIAGNKTSGFLKINENVSVDAENAILCNSQTATSRKRDELDLFFEFLKNKMQRLSQVDITGIQIEILNCVLRREAESVHK